MTLLVTGGAGMEVTAQYQMVPVLGITSMSRILPAMGDV